MTRFGITNIFLLNVLLIGYCFTLVPEGGQRPRQTSLEPRMRTANSPSENFIQQDYFLNQNTDPKRKPITTTEPWKQTYPIVYYKRSNINLNNRFKHMYANNIRSFQQLGHYSRSLIRRRQQKETENHEESEPSPWTLINQLPSPAPMFNGINIHAPLTPMALARSGETTNIPGDNKRTLFLSTGWAPSGLSEVRAEIQSHEQREDNPKTNSNSYAFTSNHWGPLGKRGVRIFNSELSNTRRKPMEILDIYEGRSGEANGIFHDGYDRPYAPYEPVEDPALEVTPDVVNWRLPPPQAEALLPIFIEVESTKRNTPVAT